VADSRYYYFALTAARAVLEAYGTGSTFTELSNTELGLVEVPVPPAQLQRSIAEFLEHATGRIDALIGQKERLIELLEEKRTALINQAVTKGLDPDVPMKGSGVEWLGEIPEHWSARRLKSVARVIPSSVDKKTREGQRAVRLCNYTDVYYSEKICAADGLMEATASDSELAKFQLREGDVIVTKDSESADDIAVPAYVARNLENVLCGYHLAIVRPRRAALNGRFLAYCFESRRLVQQFHVAANGITRFGLSVHSLRDGWLPIPPIEEQHRIASRLDAESQTVRTLSTKVREVVALLREYRSALITAAVTGKIDVRDHAA